VSGEASLSADNSEKPLGGRGSALNLAGELKNPPPLSAFALSAPPDSLAGGDRVAVPSSFHPSASIFGPSVLAPPMRNPWHALDHHNATLKLILTIMLL